MAILATFIGIDRHVDPQIRDLTGARRDAVALWALFTDSFPGTAFRLLADSDATSANVRKELRATLGAAGPDDTVIVSFSGHGTHDHRLVAYDTAVDSLASTTIGMEEVADAFRDCRARAILCLLDCCFSGGAPARVLENSPVPRDPTPQLEILSGAGRVLFSACNVNEVAYESPRYRHGLLTKAVIDVLQETSGPTSVVESLDRVMELIRAEAARMGVHQTPVLFGHVEGGLVLPPLRAGAEFHAAFPETRGAHIGKAIAELGVFGIPKPILAAWQDGFPNGLNNLQLSAVNDHRVLDGNSLLVVAPTSSGKTFVGELAAARAVAEGRKAVFLLPYKALVNEKFDQFKSLYGEKVGLRVIRCTGDFVDDTGALLRGKYDLALLTYELYLNLAVNAPQLLNALGLVVIDEAQFIADSTRGISVELLLTHLLAARETGISPQILALSAVIGNVNDFDSWLGVQALITTERPVPLAEGVLDRTGVFQSVDAAGNESTVQLLPHGAIRLRGTEAGAQDVLVPLVRKLIGEKKSVIVFRNQRGSAEGCAKYLSREVGLPAAGAVVARLPKHDLSRTAADLRDSLRGGTAFHNANLTREERVVIEQAFRNGEINVLVATTTVAAGINTPADVVIIAEQHFLGEEPRAFTVAEYKNMAGRAGRLGFKSEGTAILLAQTGMHRQQLFTRYVRGTPEQLKSSFDPRHVETWLLRLLAQIQQVPRREVLRLLANTFAGFVLNRDDPKWRPQMEDEIESLLEEMLRLGLAEEEDDKVQLTLLGRACGRSQLALRSAMRLVELLRQVGSGGITALRLMGLLQILEESDGGYTPVMKKGRKEAQWVAHVGRKYGSDIAQALQRYAKDEFHYFGRCKRAALLHDWIDGTALETLEQRYTATPYSGRIGHGDIRRFADLTRMNLRSAHQIAAVMFMGSEPAEEEIELLLHQLEIGLPSDLLGLLDLPLPLARGEYLALAAKGIRTPVALWLQPQSTIAAALGPDRAGELERFRPPADEAA